MKEVSTQRILINTSLIAPLFSKFSHVLWNVDLGGSLQTSTKRSTAYSIGKGDDGIAYYISLSELEEATNNFSKKIGKGSFGSVCYGKMRDGKEVAVKIMAESSSHGNQQFTTEVESSLLSWVSVTLKQYTCRN